MRTTQRDTKEINSPEIRLNPLFGTAPAIRALLRRGRGAWINPCLRQPVPAGGLRFARMLRETR